MEVELVYNAMNEARKVVGNMGTNMRYATQALSPQRKTRDCIAVPLAVGVASGRFQGREQHLGLSLIHI